MMPDTRPRDPEDQLVTLPDRVRDHQRAGWDTTEVDQQRADYFRLLLAWAEQATPGPEQDRHLDRIERIIAIEEGWARTGYPHRITAADMPVRFHTDDGPADGFVVGHCGHRVAESEWIAGFRFCERCPTPPDGPTRRLDEPAIVFTGRYLGERRDV